jgi:serine/threonine protein kinase
LKKDLVVITDFGLSKDVSEESVTTSSGIEIGAFKYRAPEVVLNLPRGRAADIFSLGCVFSQIFAVVKGESLAKFEDVLEEDSYGLRSFQRDIDKVLQWQERLRTSTSASTWSESQIFNLIGNMMKRDPHERPNASQVCLSLYSIGSGIEGEPSPYHGSCCPLYLDIIDRQQSQIGEYESKIGEYESKVLEMKVKMEELVRNGDELRMFMFRCLIYNGSD